MHHELGMGVRDGLQNRKKEVQTSGQRQSTARAVAIDRLALDILKNQVGLTVLAHADVEQARNMRMGCTARFALSQTQRERRVSRRLKKKCN